MIKSITMMNFLSHSDTTIDFSKGINVFVGHNGAGKSSVIDGINFVLFGKHSRNVNKNLIKRGQNKAKVELQFIVKGRLYRAIRSITQGNSYSSLYDITDGELMIIEGERRQFDESMTDEIEKILGLEYDKMNIASIIEQGKIMDVLTAKPKEFKELINSIIDIDQLDDATLSLKDNMKEFLQLQKKVIGYVPEDIPSLQQDQTNKKQDNETIEQNIITNKTNRDKIKLNINENKQKIDYYTYQKEKLNTLKHRRQEYDDYIHQKKQNISDNKKQCQRDIDNIYTTCEEKKRDIINDISQLQTTLEETQKDRETRIEELKQMIQDTKQRILDYNENKKKIDDNDITIDDLNDITKKINDITDNITKNEHDIITMEERLGISDTLQIHDGKCPLCDSTVDKLVDIFEPKEIKKHVKELKDNIKKLTEIRDDQLEHRDYIQETINQNNIYKDRIKNIKDDDIAQMLSDNDSRQRELDKDMISLREKQLIIEIKEKQELMDLGGISSEDKQRIDELYKKINDLDDTLVKIDDTILDTDKFARNIYNDIIQLEKETNTFDEDSLYQLESKQDELNSQLGDIDNVIGGLNERLQNNNNIIQTIQNVLPKLKELNDYIQYIDKINNNVYSRDSPVARSLRSWALDIISRKTSEYISSLNTKISSIHIKEKERKVTITCYQNGKELDIKSLSGGEKISTALALRLGMSDILGTSGTNLMILDEPTIYLDERSKQSFVQVLNALSDISNNNDTQFVIVTHDTEIFENSSVDKIFKFDSSSGNTIINEINNN